LCSSSNISITKKNIKVVNQGAWDGWGIQHEIRNACKILVNNNNKNQIPLRNIGH
jgi:hypothetical protein